MQRGRRLKGGKGKREERREIAQIGRLDYILINAYCLFRHHHSPIPLPSSSAPSPLLHLSHPLLSLLTSPIIFLRDCSSRVRVRIVLPLRHLLSSTHSGDRHRRHGMAGMTTEQIAIAAHTSLTKGRQRGKRREGGMQHVERKTIIEQLEHDHNVAHRFDTSPSIASFLVHLSTRIFYCPSFVLSY